MTWSHSHACLSTNYRFVTHPRSQQQQRRLQSAALDPLDPPLPLWETEAEHVTRQQQPKQQYQQQQQQRGEGQYSEVIRIDGELGKVPQLASKL
jgi:hypothetical protein